ncbi:hypothetical protein LCGC14_1496680 [marine sediment metagenome]|uniref:Uncharacterized protein n=1 Tax=marine sediment metagenome TaxID=412755 RepID=A0A0F9JR54_9ZZZZ
MNIFTGTFGILIAIILYVIILFVGTWITLFMVSLFPKRLRVIYKIMTSEPKKNKKLNISPEQ